MNGKGDKFRVKWSREYEQNFNNIFKKEKECLSLGKDLKKN